MTIVFFGDSITDVEYRDMWDPREQFSCYALIVAERVKEHVIAKGVPGETVNGLVRRLGPDVLAHEPTLVSILIGVNDAYQESEGGADAEAFERSYRLILERIAAAGARIVLMEPFLVGDEYWRPGVDSRIAVVRRLAREFGAALVPADGIMNAAACRERVTRDGVHPNARGDAVLAEAWIRYAGLGG
ncbi:MAG: GDSL-type esterase/lipase family protein [Propionibacteriaceae bacterium]|jgi:lysophospholipase L1-like esterase|nr:GDSL-type esterase/lipase family protein [Propionibacteriaceae bacterium]